MSYRPWPFPRDANNPQCVLYAAMPSSPTHKVYICPRETEHCICKFRQKRVRKRSSLPKFCVHGKLSNRWAVRTDTAVQLRLLVISLFADTFTLQKPTVTELK